MYIDKMSKILDTELNAIKDLSTRLDQSYDDAINLILDCKGKVVISGVGKSGHIGSKLAATFASTGSPSFFMHSTEGVHGDLGMVERNDVVILISNSGETQEVLSLLPTLKKIGVKIISITSNRYSTLSDAADVSLTFEYKKEADSLNLAPSTSSTLTLIIGDILALTVSEIKRFNYEDFHLYHPGGSLGKKLSEK